MLLLLICALSCQQDAEESSGGIRWKLDKGKEDEISLLSEIDVGDLLVTEIMHDPTQVPDYKGEWIELYNPLDTSIDLNGLEVTSTGETGFVISQTLVIPTKGFVILAANNIPTDNGSLPRVDYKYNYNSLKLNGTETIEISSSGKVLDAVSYQYGNQTLQAGNSFSLMPQHFNSLENDALENWCISVSSYGDGDLGTPGEPNDSCVPSSELSSGDIIITEVMTDPVSVRDWKGEWFELYNNRDEIVDLKGIELFSSGENGILLSESLYIYPQDYAVFSVSSAAENGGFEPDWIYNYNLLKLLPSDSLHLFYEDLTLDSVTWDLSDWTSQTGASYNLSIATFSAADRTDLSYWCESTTNYTSLDLGTPGEANISCDNTDFDQDGYTVYDGDCDDMDPLAYPYGIETCDGIDNNCNGLLDDADPEIVFTEEERWYLDVDGDGYGGLWIDPVYACETPVDGYGGDYADNDDDCDDENANAYPGGLELIHDGVDGNCDGWDGDCAFGECDWGVYIGSTGIIDMMLIPAGQDPLGRYSLSQDFYMMSTEVTQGQYERLMGQLWLEEKSSVYALGTRYPVYYTSWYMAADFANHLTSFHNDTYGSNWEQCYSCSDSETVHVVCEEISSPYDCDGFRLPTEAEWEYAARSGTTADIWTGEGVDLGGYITPSWDCSVPAIIEDGVSNPLLSDYSWNCQSGNNKTVANKLPNGFGLYDMHGNEWEWTHDWEGCSYPNASLNPYCDQVSETKTRKGGDWNDYPFNHKIYPRYAKPPADRYGSIGFRLVRGIPE